MNIDLLRIALIALVLLGPATQAVAAPPATRRSRAGPWLVVLLGALFLLVGAAALEVVHRSELVKLLGRPPASWSGAQVRAYSRAQSLYALGDPHRAGETMRAVAEMRPSGDVTAAAWWQYAYFGIHFENHAQRAKYARKALAAAPDDSPKLCMYYRLVARELAALDRCGQIVTLAWETVRRATDTTQRGLVASHSVYRLVEPKHPADALELYDRYREHDAELAASDSVRLYVADALVELDRREEALRLLREIVAAGEPKHRRRAEERLRELEGGAAR